MIAAILACVSLAAGGPVWAQLGPINGGDHKSERRHDRPVARQESPTPTPSAQHHQHHHPAQQSTPASTPAQTPASRPHSSEIGLRTPAAASRHESAPANRWSQTPAQVRPAESRPEHRDWRRRPEIVAQNAAPVSIAAPAYRRFERSEPATSGFVRPQREERRVPIARPASPSMRDAATRPEPKWTFITPSSRSSRLEARPAVSAHPVPAPSVPAGSIQPREKRLERRELIWDHRFVPAPRRDERGGALKLVPVLHPPATPPVRDAVWQSKINRLERVERVPNRYYWHREAGWNTCHYVDAWGEHWYGVRSGASFYWLRRHANRWWWHDPVAHQWLLWNAGLWVWPNPSTLEIVYVGAPPPVIEPAPAAAAEAAPSEPAGPSAEGVSIDIASAEQTIGSSDGKRLVSIYGNDHDALLFDTSKGGEPVYLAFLSSGARDAEFFRSKEDEPWEIVLFMDDGSLKRFDADGKPYRSSAGAGLRLPGTEISQEPAVDTGL